VSRVSRAIPAGLDKVVESGKLAPVQTMMPAGTARTTSFVTFL
jgi:hypothetical protein